ncbi:hypothetical protein [Leuconostoc inhae]|uniref:hypothetical protein n=1 Tax=Leuconostoc inhae TaxID=178001 RepID=UPI001C7D71E8|nr:hypothetical protein [Leuconostoc inhae]
MQLTKNFSLAAATIVGAGLFAVSAPTVSADTTSNNDINTVVSSLSNGNSVYSDRTLQESKYGMSKLAKTAIKTILNNRSAAKSVVQKLGGKTAANAFDRNFGAISSELKPLLKWADVPSQAVYDATYRALRGSVSNSTAVSVANALAEGISWLI